MNGPNPVVFGGILYALALAVSGSYVLAGGVHVGGHEIDLYHLLDILFRMEAGQRPHEDFVTPLGILAFQPIVLFLKAGLGAGMAFVAAQLLVAALLIPALVRLGVSRLDRRAAWVLGVVSVLVVLALTWGTPDSPLAISMHYNRWSWAIAFTVVLLALLEPRRRPNPRLDGALIGLGFGCLVLLKITYAIALAPGLLLAVVQFQDRKTLLAALSAGIFVAAAATGFFGLTFWFDYAGDLLNVSDSKTRPNAGTALGSIISDPRYIGGYIAVIYGYSVLARNGATKEGRALLLLVAGFSYITYQNAGTEPLWLVVVAVLFYQWRDRLPEKPSRHLALAVASAASFALPGTYNTIRSPLQNLTQSEANSLPAIAGERRVADLRVNRDRADSLLARVDLEETTEQWTGGRDGGSDDRADVAEPTGRNCIMLSGVTRSYERIAELLPEAGVRPEDQIFAVGLAGSVWLFGTSAPLQGGAPWYYGELSGIENADYVLFPKCIFGDTELERIMLSEIEEAGVPLETVADNDIFTLFALR